MAECFIAADKNGCASFIYDKCAFSGVKKIAGKVRNDVFLVTGKNPDAFECESLDELSSRSGLICGNMPDGSKHVIFVATAGSSPVLSELEKTEKINLGELCGKRECYGWYFVDKPCRGIDKMLVIAGSDKRGTVYGLFHLSDMMNVSPLVNWSDVVPCRSESVIIRETDLLISKEPSVKYRGFFINDEWPAFGNWAMKHFGGVNASLYEGVFELLLRMKGNYLWPAMWASCFACDGPGLASAELADEYGVVMGMSHHEPCLRHGEEYRHLRGKDSIYGDAWNFRTNADGITKFWEDGLRRNGHLENVITIGMRGECDSAILGNATLKDNIDLLKDVINTQHRLIRENVNSDLAKVPRMLALYKEVEPFYYGEPGTPGLKDWDELEDVILMLCDDNHGYLRTLPDEDMRRHRGGFGMYYHFDYHGDPVSYEWTNSTDLTECWEQMTCAYEHGVRDLWIVNVGDLGLQEFPLTFFMNLAYDYDTWGISASDVNKKYTKKWVDLNFASSFDEKSRNQLTELMLEYTRLSHSRRPEHLNDRVFSSCHFGEAKRVLLQARKIMQDCDELKDKLPAENSADFDKKLGAFIELVYYNAYASSNLFCLWIYTQWNHYLAQRGASEANSFIQLIKDCMNKDIELRELLHSADGGKWYGFGLAKHIGFKHWNSEERCNPVYYTVQPLAEPVLICGDVDSEQYTGGGDWTGKNIVLKVLRGTQKNTKNTNRILSAREISDENTAVCAFYLASGSDCDVPYEIEWNDDWILINGKNAKKISGVISKDKPFEVFSVTCHLDKISSDTMSLLANTPIDISGTGKSLPLPPQIIVHGPEGNPKINLSFEPDMYISIDAADWTCKKETMSGKVMMIDGLSRDGNGVKFTPVTKDFSSEGKNMIPYLEYELDVPFEGDGIVQFYMMPANSFVNGRNLKLRYAINDGCMQTEDILPKVYVVGHTPEWEQSVLDHVRIHTSSASFKKGRNKITFYAGSPGIVLEKIVAARNEKAVPSSYYGPLPL